MDLNPVFEYISAGLIVFLILGVAGQYAATLVQNKVVAIGERGQVQKADVFLDMLLLSSGDPPDWGNDFNEPRTIGFALDNSITTYELDVAKVKRLSTSSQRYIAPHRIRDLTGLDPSFYISIKIFPLFNVSMTQVSSEVFNVQALNQYGIPVPNLNITGGYLNKSIDELSPDDIVQFIDGILGETCYASGMTDPLGACTLQFLGAGDRQTLIVTASRLGVTCVTTWPTLSSEIVGVIESSMGVPSAFNVETVYRNVRIQGLSYIVRLSIWR